MCYIVDWLNKLIIIIIELYKLNKTWEKKECYLQHTNWDINRTYPNAFKKEKF